MPIDPIGSSGGMPTTYPGIKPTNSDTLPLPGQIAPNDPAAIKLPGQKTPDDSAAAKQPGKKADQPKGAATKGGKKLTPEQEREVARLRARDAEVRAHEMAHMAAGGGLAGAPHYQYQVGPDGQQYAVSGEVNIDTSSERDPKSTINKMQRVKAAALAPANPSGQDRAVARTADAKITQAQRELLKARQAGVKAELGRNINAKA